MLVPSALSIILGSIVALLIIIVPIAIVAWVIVSVVNRGGKDSPQSKQESQMMQELYHGLSKMEARLEALETILLERESRRDA